MNHDDYMDKFLHHAFRFNLQMSMLGICSNYHESLCYHRGSIDSPQAIKIGLLLGNLVDSAKGGFTFDETTWLAFLQQQELPRTLKPPAYKDRKKRGKIGDNLIDQLVFRVAREERERALRNFSITFKDIGSWDKDLIDTYKQENQEAKTHKPLQAVLDNLKVDLETIFLFWRLHARREDEDEDILPSRSSTTLSFRSVVERCREDFVALPPRVGEIIHHNSSDMIRRWQQKHVKGESSYWDLLKASTAFHVFHKTSPSFVWYLAGIELGEIKATKSNRGTYRCIVNSVHATLKIDGKLVDGVKRREMQLEDLKKAEDDYDDDDEDEYGSFVDVDEDMMEL